MQQQDTQAYLTVINKAFESSVESIKDLQAEIKELREKFSTLGEVETIKSLIGRVDKLYKVVVEGNGREALQETMRKLDSRLVKIEDFVEKESKCRADATGFRRMVLVSVVTAITSAIVMTLFGVIQKLV